MSYLAVLRDALRNAGRHGPVLLLGGVMLGLIVPALAAAVRPLMGLRFSVLRWGVLKVDFPAFKVEMQQGWPVLLVLLWVTFGVPASMLMAIEVLQPVPALAQGLMLCTLAPPVGSAAAIAAMLGFSAPLALLTTVAATVASPLYLPILAHLLAGVDVSVDPLRMAWVLLLIVGGACLGATLMRRYAHGFVQDNPDAMTGVAVTGLILVAIGAMRGMQTHFLANPAEAILFLAVAFSVNAGSNSSGCCCSGGWTNPARWLSGWSAATATSPWSGRLPAPALPRIPPSKLIWQ